MPELKDNEQMLQTIYMKMIEFNILYGNDAFKFTIEELDFIKKLKLEKKGGILKWLL
jgi:hypothetical protein